MIELNIRRELRRCKAELNKVQKIIDRLELSLEDDKSENDEVIIDMNGNEHLPYDFILG